VLAFTFLSEQPTLVRVGALIGGLAVGVAIAWLSEPGQAFSGLRPRVLSGDETGRLADAQGDGQHDGHRLRLRGADGDLSVRRRQELEWFLYDLLLSLALKRYQG